MEGGEGKLLWPMGGSSVMKISAADWCLNSELLLITAAVKPPGKTAECSIPPSKIDESPPPLTFVSSCFCFFFALFF